MPSRPSVAHHPDCACLAQADGAGSSSSGSCYTSSAEEGGTDDDDEELSIRVNDLVPPVTRRAAYEMEWEDKPAVEGFEVINWGASAHNSHQT